MLKTTLLTSVIGAVALTSTLIYAQQPPPAAGSDQAKAPAGQVDPKTASPVQVAGATPKGQLKNPYKDTDAAAVQQGGQLWLNYGCNGCHGGGGGGGMCPPVINDVWVYGGDDDTLFRLVSYGSQALQGQGYSRTGMENVVGPMPPMGGVVKTGDDLWRILAWVRSKYDGAPECKFGCPKQH